MYDHAKIDQSILEIQKILQSHDQKAKPIFDHAHQITKVTYSFSEYVLACKKSVKFIHSFRNLKYHVHFWPRHPKIIKVIFNFPQFAATCKKSAQFIHSFLQYSRF